MVCEHEYASECVCSVGMLCNLSFIFLVVEVPGFLPVVFRLESSSSYLLSKRWVTRLLSNPGYENCFFLFLSFLLPEMPSKATI